MLIINADDWGLSRATTDAIADCFLRDRISAASAMVFMEDSARAADVAREIGLDVGLHLNLTEPYAAPNVPPEVRRAQTDIIRFLASSKFSSVLYNLRLRNAFRTTVDAQVREFRRLHGADPSHIDGHHHQHLCANVLFGRLLPAGSIARRHFTFFAGEKPWANRAYRAVCDRYLSRHCSILDGFFDLAENMALDRLARLAEIARDSVIEIMTHPAHPKDYTFLISDDFGTWLRGVELIDFRAPLAGGMRPQPM